MKKFTLILTAALFGFSFSVLAQNICNPPCTPDVSCIETLNPGEVCPEILPSGMVGVYYDETITVIPPPTFNLLGSNQTIYQIRIDAVENIPPGMAWCKSEEMFIVTTPYTRYCCQLTGTPTTPGEYHITLKITPYKSFFGSITALPQQTDDTSLLVVVLPHVDAPVAGFSGTPTSIEAGMSVTFTDASTNNPTQLGWVFEGGTPPTSSAPTQVVTYAESGSYDVSLTATNAGGSNTITMSDYIIVSSGADVNTSLLSKVNIYPNPVSQELTVEAANLQSITIVDVLGKVVFTKTAKSDKETVDVSSLLKANYFIKVKTAEGEITKTITVR